MKRLIVVVTATLLVVACGDDVPKVDDPHNIVVDGAPMTQAEFIGKYCAGKADNATCMTVLVAKRKDSTRGKLKVEW